MKNTLTFLIVLVGTISTLFAQTNKPSLVKDIKVGVDGSRPTGFAELNGKIYFTAEGDFNSVYTAADRRLFSMSNSASMPQVVPFNFGGGTTVNASLSTKSPFSLQNNLFLFVRRNNTVEEMWKTDGITSSLVDTVSNYGINGSLGSTIASVYKDKFYIEAYYFVNNRTLVDLYRHTGLRGSKQFVAKLNREEVLPTGSFFSVAYEKVDTYYPTPDVTYTDVTFDSIGGTNLRGLRRTIRAFDHTTGISRDIYTVAWRGSFGSSTDLLTTYKIVGAVNSNLLFTSTARGTVSAPADTLFSLDKMGVKTILKTNIGSSSPALTRGKTIVLDNRIIFLDDYSRIWESDGTAAGTRILPSNGAVEIYQANGQLYYLRIEFLPNSGSRTHVYAVGGAEIGSYESAEGEYDKVLVFQNNKDVFLVPQITQADTTKRLLIRLGDAQTPFKVIGLISKCKKDFDNPYKMPIDSTCPCLNLTNSAPPFTVVDSTLLFVAYDQPYGGEVWKMNLNASTTPPPNPFITDNKPSLVKDINTGEGFPATSTRSSFIYGFTTFNNRTYFSAEPDLNDYRGNRRLYSLTNGTSTPQLVPLNFGVEGRLAGQQKPHLMQNALFTVVRNNETIYELWKGDGMTATFVDTLSNYGRFMHNSTVGEVYNDKLFYTESYNEVNNTKRTDLYRHSGVRGSKQFIAKLYRQDNFPTGSFFAYATEETQKYFPTPDVTFADITFDSFSLTSLRGIRRTMRAYDNANGSFVDLFTIAWRRNFGETSSPFTRYKTIGVVNSKLLFTSRETSTSENATRDTIFSFDRYGVRTIVQLNAGSPVHVLNLDNRIVYLDVFNQIWETDGSAAGTRLLVPKDKPILGIFAANGKVYYLSQSYIANNRYLSKITVIGGGEVARFESFNGAQIPYNPIFISDNKDLFFTTAIRQGDTTIQKLFRIEDSATPLREIGLIAKCRLSGYLVPVDTTCPCIRVVNNNQFTIVDSTLIFSASDVAHGEELWRMNLGTSNAPNPCATDTTKPIFTNIPTDVTVNCLNIVPVAATLTATDNCTTQPTVVLTEVNAGDTLITRTWRATDARGNFATAVQRIVIRDIIAPTITNCPANQTFTTTSTCQIVTWIAPTATDNCAGTPIVTQTHNSGFCFPIGTTTVTYTAKDGRNNQKTCSFVVTINAQVSRCNLFSANTLAINNCPANITVTAPSGSTCLAVNWTPPTAVQAVGTNAIPVRLTTNFSPNYCFPIGSTNVVYTATDSCGNVKACNFTVTVNPTVAVTCKKYTVAGTNSICNPATYQPFLLRNGANRYVAETLEFKEINATTATLKGSLRDANWQIVPIDLTFSGKSASGTPQLINCLTPSVSAANWTYYTTVLGTIGLPTGVINVNLATNALQMGTSANTQNFGELGGYAKIGNATMTFDLIFKLSNPVNVNCDGGGVVNCATDSVPPVLSGIPANVTTDCFAIAPVAAIATATDNCTANVTIRFQEVRGADFLQRTWTATDARGNASTGSQRITILDRIPPVISNCPTTVNANTTAACTTVIWSPPTATDVCGATTLSSNLPLTNCFAAGTTPVIYTATDAAGNRSTCTFNVVVTNGVLSSGLDLSIAATPSQYRYWTPINYRISLKNNGLVASNGIKITFEPADLQVGGGSATASIGTFNEYCAGGIACREWTIPSLAAGATATLDIPRFVLNPVVDLVSKAKLLTPSVSEAIVRVSSAANALNGGTARLSRPQSTQLVPVIVQYLSPNPTLNDIEVEMESLDERDVVFMFSDAFGNIVQSENRRVTKGFQIKTFDVSALPQGVYFIQISTNRARNVPVKFVKM